MKRQHSIIETRDRDGRKLVHVPLGPNSQGDAYATILKTDYEYLLSIGLSKTWARYPNGLVTAPAHRARGSQVTVARVLLDAKPGQQVKYKDGNRRNLRRENLDLIEGGGATRRDRDYLTPVGSRPGRPRKINTIRYLQANTNQ